mgnify:FL=1
MFSSLRKYKLLFSLAVLLGQVGDASEFSVAIEHRLMDRNWSFLPQVPPSYQSAAD